MWCLWKERNYQNFEDLEQTTVELEAFFFKTLYHCAAIFDFNISIYQASLELFSSFN
jgi:hypothetical protein